MKNVQIMAKVKELIEQLDPTEDIEMYSAEEDYEGNLLTLPDFGEVVKEKPDNLIYAMSWLSAGLFKE